VGVSVAPAQVNAPQPDGKAEAVPSAQAGPPRTERRDGVEAVLAPEDRLHPRAFEIVAAEFARSPEVQAVYADVREAGMIVPHPAFDRVLAAATDYVGLPVFFRVDGLPGSNAWERLMLAAKAGPGAISRIALPLAERPAAVAAAVPSIPQPTLDPAPRVSVVIPTKFRVDLLEQGLDGLRDATGYPGLEVVIVDNGSKDPRFREVLNAAKASLDVTLVEDHGAFNFSRLVNAGARRSTGEVILLLNDDVTPVEPGWLHRMVQSALMPGVGAVGARLTYPDGSIQHAGVMLGLGGVAGHLWKGMSKADAQRSPYVALPGSRLAVTGACLAVRRSVFEEAGGLDEMFPVAFNDIDFCLRLHARGLRTVYRGDAVLVHHEGQSRGQDDESTAKRKRLAAETRKFLDRWKGMTWDDPYGSPAFDPLSESGAVHRSLIADQARSLV
jgi:GT2 family glycosyltransferase